MCVCVCTQKYIQTYTYVMHIYTYTYVMHIYTYTYIMHIYIHIHNALIYIHIRDANMHVYIGHIGTQIHTHICIYIHTHISYKLVEENAAIHTSHASIHMCVYVDIHMLLCRCSSFDHNRGVRCPACQKGTVWLQGVGGACFVCVCVCFVCV